MAKIMELAVNLSMLTSGNLIPEATAAGRTLSALQAKCSSLQSASSKITGFQKQRASLEQLRSRMEQARVRVRTLREEFKNTDTPTDAMKKRFADAQRTAGRLEGQFQTQRKRLAELNSELLKSGVNTGRLISEQQRLASETDKVRAAQDRLADAQQKFARLRGNFDWGNIKTDIMKSAVFLETFRAPIKVDMEFEQAMAQVKAVANPSPEQFTALRAQALQLGSATQFTSTQSASAQETLMRAGLKAEEVLTALPHVLQTAGAEGMSIDQAADILINVTKNMNLPVSELGRVADVMAYTSAHSNTNIAQLGEAALKAAGPFSSMGGSVEELMATLGAMSNTVRGAEAGTALAGVTRRLGKNPKAVSKELSAYGIKTMTRQGDFAPLAEIIAQVELQAEKMGSKKAAGLRANVYGMFGSQMQGFGRTLFNGEYSGLLKGTQQEASGASRQMNFTRNDTLKGDITGLGSAWEGLMIRIGAALDPINRFFAQTLTKGLQKLNELIDAMGPFADILVQAGYAVGGFMVLKTVYKYAKLSIEAVKAFIELKGAVAAIEGTSTAFGGLSTTLGSLGTIIMAHPIVIIGTLVAGAVALAIANWEKLKAWWDSWTPAPKTALTIEQAETAKQEVLNKYNTTDLRPSYMKTASPPPGIPAHAQGGILTRPHLGLVAEAGPEAVIPLSKPSLGVPLLMQAADILGVLPEQQNYSAQRAASFLNSAPQAPASVPASPVNITVNVAGSSEDEGLAVRIAQAVRDALRDIMSLEERVSYA